MAKTTRKAGAACRDRKYEAELICMKKITCSLTQGGDNHRIKRSGEIGMTTNPKRGVVTADLLMGRAAPTLTGAVVKEISEASVHS